MTRLSHRNHLGVILHPADDGITAAKQTQSKDAGPNAEHEALLAAPYEQDACPPQMMSKVSSPVWVAHHQLH